MDHRESGDTTQSWQMVRSGARKRNSLQDHQNNNFSRNSRTATEIQSLQNHHHRSTQTQPSQDLQQQQPSQINRNSVIPRPSTTAQLKSTNSRPLFDKYTQNFINNDTMQYI